MIHATDAKIHTHTDTGLPLYHSRLKMFPSTPAGEGQHIITLDPRLPFPDSVGGIFPGPATTQKVYYGIEWFF